MILGPHSPCFVEIDEAVAQLQAARGDSREVVFHWQHDVTAIPRGAVIYNFDFPGIHFDLGAMRVAANRADEVWDFSKRGVAMWKAIGVEAKHVPVGFHPSMVRFERRADPDIDVVFVGSINERRARILQWLIDRGAHVEVAPVDRRERDNLLARCHMSINMLYYETGVFPVLRAAHLAANDVPALHEICAETPAWARHGVAFDLIQQGSVRVLKSDREAFETAPMVLP